MTKKQAKQIFEKYNPESAVKRCPHGRMPMRKLLDRYAKAAVNLYGILPVKDLAEIFNKQNTEQTDADEVFTLLLPVVLKESRLIEGPKYCFYKDCVVHYFARDNFDFCDYLLHEQKDKPRFVPNKNEFLKYEDEYYEYDTQEELWDDVLYFILKEWPDFRDTYTFYEKIKQNSQIFGEVEIHGIVEEYKLSFSSKEQIQLFFDLFSVAHNNTRMWVNNGHTPKEAMKASNAKNKNEGYEQTIIREHRKIGANERCSCGSGKKYKKCCHLVEETKTAQLHWSECLLFYETWYGLMGFVNKKKNVINNVEIKPIYPNPVGDELIHKIREVLWETPDLIDEYLATVSLPKEKAELLKSWRNHHIKDMFLLVDHKAEYSILVGSDKKEKDTLFGVKGISRSLANVLPYELPIHVETVLLPFKDKIIYDSLIGTRNISFGNGAKEMFAEMYKKALKNGITTHLAGEDPPGYE